MPAGIVFQRMLFIATVVPFLAGTKTLVDQIGSVMWPGVGGLTLGSGINSHSGWPRAVAAASPCRWRVTVLLKASLRDTVKFGPVVGDTPARVMADGGAMAKSGTCISVP